MKLLYNACIHTLDRSWPEASALLVDCERVLAVGGPELLTEFDSAERHDLGGRTVLPGLIDAHLHLMQTALGLLYIDCETGSMEECLRRVARQVQRAGPGEWVRGHGWNQNEWGGAWPTAADLDALAPATPVFLTAKSLHAGWANSCALRLAGIGAGTPDPPGGKFVRDGRGQPTGILLESACAHFQTAIPDPPLESVVYACKTAQSWFWQMGLTGAHDFDPLLAFRALQVMEERGELRLRVLKSIPVERLEEAVALGLSGGSGSDRLRSGSVKIFVDGALGPRTAAMLEDYSDAPGNRGILHCGAEAVFEYGCQAARHGLSLAVHAIGDRANCEAVAGLARLRAHEKRAGLPALRHRIEHVQLIRAEAAGSLASLQLIASMQPVHATSDMFMADRAWGERAADAYAWQSLARRGVRLAFGSDAPVESPNPFRGLHAAVTRCRRDGTPGPAGWYPEQRLDLRSALDGYTLGPACAAGMEDRLGRLAPGCLADLIVLDTDPFACDPRQLYELRPVATMFGGEWVWQE
jgi:hypothetical protein